MKIVLLIFLCCTFHAAFSRTLKECSSTGSYKLLNSREFTGNLFESIRVRFPETGAYPEAITCIWIIDENNGHSNPIISQGGLMSNYVEITINPWLLEELKYRFEIYADANAKLLIKSAKNVIR